MRVLVKADWSDNNSTLAWKTPNDIRSFHLQVSEEVIQERREVREFFLVVEHCLSWWYAIGTSDEYLGVSPRHWNTQWTGCWTDEEEYRNLSSVGIRLFDLVLWSLISLSVRHLVYFSSYISTISTLAKFFNSSLKLVDTKQRLFNSNTPFEDSFSPSSSPSVLTPLRESNDVLLVHQTLLA